MERFLFIPPAVVTILIFMYMRNQQAKRNDKLRERFWKREEEILKKLTSKKDMTDDK